MFFHAIALPFVLKLGSAQGFVVPIPEKTVLLRFIIQEDIKASPHQKTVAVIESDKKIEPGDLIPAYFYINNVIRAYRLVTGETYNDGVISPLSSDQFFKAIFQGEIDEKGKLKSETNVLYSVRGYATGPITEPMYSEIKQLAILQG